MKKLNTKGFGILQVLLLLVIVGMIAGIGYYVYNSQKETNKSLDNTGNSEVVNANSDVSAENGDESGKTITQSLSVEHFSIELPKGWSQVDNPEKPAGVPQFYYEFKNESGKKLGVSVNSGGFGGGGDGGADFSIVDNKISLEDMYDACNTNDDLTGACRFGDGKLNLVISTSDRYKGNDYIVWIEDSTSESQDAYKNIANIAETIVLK